MTAPVLEVLSVCALDNRWLKIVLSNGKEGVFDMSPYLSGEFFGELKDAEYFSRVTTVFGNSGIGWPNGQDISAYKLNAEIEVSNIT